MKQKAVETISRIGKYAFGLMILSVPIGKLLPMNDGIIFILLLGLIIASAAALVLLVDKIRND